MSWTEVACLGLGAGLVLRLVGALFEVDMAARTAAMLIILPLALVLRREGPRSQRTDLGIGILAASTWILGLIVPIEASDTGWLVVIHGPLLLWCLMGVWTAGQQWTEREARIHYLLQTGEILVFTGAILLGGVLLTLLTLAMFSVISIDIGRWYSDNVVVVGVAAAPIVAAGLARARELRGEALAPQLARIFSPLALVTLGAYAVAIVWTGQSPHEDRSALIVLNAMLAAAAALIALASLSPQPESRNRVLAAIQAWIAWIAVCVDVFALFTILYRTVEGGWTPNRVAVLGENLLLLCFLTGVADHLTRFARGRSNRDQLAAFVARMLPFFAGWTAFVIFVLPMLFRFA